MYRGRLADLDEAEEPAEEPPRGRLAAGRRGDLDVVDPHEGVDRFVRARQCSSLTLMRRRGGGAGRGAIATR
jgi:hypothetical protein